LSPSWRRTEGNAYQLVKDQGWPTGYSVDAVEGSADRCIGACLAWGTLVEVPGGFRPIQSINVGDEVLAAGKDLGWSTCKVQFSNGTSPGTSSPGSVYLLFGEPVGEIVVTPDHLFLMSDRTMKRADHLTPGLQLMGRNGNPIPIFAFSLGEFRGGFHTIATSKQKPDGNLTEHLIATSGLVSGDYAAQLFFVSGSAQSKHR
jgi:hypothetical protein